MTGTPVTGIARLHGTGDRGRPGERRRRLPALGALVVVLAAASTVLIAAVSGAFGPRSEASPLGASAGSCRPPALPGAVVDVTLTDMRAHMGMPAGGLMPRQGGASGAPVGPTLMSRWPAGMMHVELTPASVSAGTVSLRVRNVGGLVHELVVLPLAAGQRAGERAVGTDLTVDESGALGEVSRTCGAGAGEGIAPGSSGWTTLTLAAGRYELVCNLPGHYEAGMHAELDVRG